MTRIRRFDRSSSACSPRSRRGTVLAACAVLFTTVIAPAAAQWYASDEHGELGDRIEESEREAHEYVLRIDREDDTEVRTLYREDEVVERRELEFADGMLVARRISRGDEVVSTEHYRYWRDGSLRRVRVVSESDSSVEYRYRDGRLAEEWVDTDDGYEVIEYDELGRIESRTRWENDDVAERESREYWGDTAGDALRRIVLVADGIETVQRYDEDGRLEGTATSREGVVESDRTRVFEDGVLVEEREQRGDILRVWRYEYEAEEVVVERYLENGDLVRRTDYAVDGYSRLETLFRGGEPVLRVFYQGEERVLEEILRDGEVVRTRTFERTEASE
ncbi:MAG: hypothetical protein ACOC0E_00445 [Spirochaetota bacterium]